MSSCGSQHEVEAPASVDVDELACSRVEPYSVALLLVIPWDVWTLCGIYASILVEVYGRMENLCICNCV